MHGTKMETHAGPLGYGWKEEFSKDEYVFWSIIQGSLKHGRKCLHDVGGNYGATNG